MSGAQKSSGQNQRVDSNTRQPRKYMNPKGIVIRNGKCYTVEEYYGKEDPPENNKK